MYCNFEPLFTLFPESEEYVSSDSLSSIFGGEELLDKSILKSKNSIFQIFETYSDELVIDDKWCTTLRKYVYSFTTRREGNVDYMEFFGSPYLGLQKIVFKSKDRNEWFSEIIDIDEVEVRDNIHNSSLIKKNWNVVGDVFNLSICYLIYKVHHSKVNDKLKHQAMVDLICMYHYKCLTSIIDNDYKYTARREVAVETYNRLSMKYDIKRYGSWRALIEARAEFILDKKTGIHYEAFTKMDDDKKVIYMIGDIQDRLRGVINDINKVFHDVKNKTNLIKFDGNTVNLEDGVALKHNVKEEEQFKNYIEQILSSGSSFYKDELIDYAVKDMSYTPRDKLAFIIEEFPAIYNSKKGEEYQEYVNEILVHLFEYLHTNKIKKTNMYNVLVKMRGAYNSRRGNTKELIYLRETGDELVKKITGIKTPVTVTGLRTSFMLYVVLRTLSKDYYS